MSDAEGQFSIRDIAEADFDAWAELRHLLWPDNTEEELRESCRDYFADETTLWFVLVAENESGLIGMIEVSLRAYAEGAQSSPTPFVEGWFVREDVRGRGVGAALMAAVEEFCKEEGYGELCSDTLADNALSQTVHGALGFAEVERIVCYRKAL